MTVIVTLYIYNPLKILQGMTNIGGLPFGVGDTTPRFTISIGHDS